MRCPDGARVARCQDALGDFVAAREALDRATSLSARLIGPSPQALQLFSARLDMRFAQEADTREPLAQTEPFLQQPGGENSCALAAIRATAAFGYAQLGRIEEALRWLETLLPPLERAPDWAPNYTLMARLCVAALWALERVDHIEVIERNLREKVNGPDFRFPMQDSRLSMARLCALQGCHEEASEWFARARDVLGEQGARPLRAMTDLDETAMLLRRGARGDLELARPLLDAALQQFRSLGMTGWVARGERMAEQLERG